MLAAVVLAGGRSTRMGAPKEALPWHGGTVIARVCGLLARDHAPVVVVRRPGQALPDLPAGVEVAEDALPDRGPLQGLLAGLQAISSRNHAAFVSAADAPLLHPALVRAIEDELGQHDVCVPVAGERAHVLCAAYRTSVLPALEAMLAVDRLRVSDLLGQVDARRLDVGDLADVDRDLLSLRSFNAPGEHAEAHALPEPTITLVDDGDVRVVRAAWLGRAVADLPREVELNGRLAPADALLPLAEGDVVRLIP